MDDPQPLHLRGRGEQRGEGGKEERGGEGEKEEEEEGEKGERWRRWTRGKESEDREGGKVTSVDSRKGGQVCVIVCTT